MVPYELRRLVDQKMAVNGPPDLSSRLAAQWLGIHSIH
jgi:hypothetical protein